MVQWHRAAFYRETLPRVRKLALRIWRDAIAESDVSLRVQLSREFRELMDMRRQLLGFPSPGRRRNEGEREERNISVPIVSESAPAQAQAESQAPAPAPE